MKKEQFEKFKIHVFQSILNQLIRICHYLGSRKAIDPNLNVEIDAYTRSPPADLELLHLRKSFES